MVWSVDLDRAALDSIHTGGSAQQITAPDDHLPSHGERDAGLSAAENHFLLGRNRDPFVIHEDGAQLGGLRTRDLIQRIDEFDIKGLKSYRKALEAITERQPERVVFVVLRGVRTHFQYVEPDWKPSTGREEETNRDDEE